MPALATHRFTAEEYYRMAETGVLPPDARVELLEGEIVDRMPSGPFHAGTTNRLAKFFIRLGQDNWEVAIQTPVRLNEYSEPQPDLMLLKPEKHGYLKRHPEPEDVFLLIEVADSSLAVDRAQKLPLYGRPSTTVLREGEIARPEAFPEAAVDVAALLLQAA
ncbi:MAG: Uma2 family endonuclease [Proteobacteria bacterium]|nr:Uma2 family endonuclease [Pseudomonadota bacterium]